MIVECRCPKCYCKHEQDMADFRYAEWTEREIIVPRIECDVCLLDRAGPTMRARMIARMKGRPLEEPARPKRPTRKKG